VYRAVLAAASLALLAGSTVAVAAPADRLQDGYGGPPTQPLGFAFDHITPTPKGHRKLEMEVNVRVRAMSVPRSILDTWYRDEDDPEWAYVEGRPKIAGTTAGLEYVVKGNNQNGLFYVEYTDSAMKDGYWDDPDESYIDGDYLRPSKGLGLIGVGANYAYGAPLVKLGDTQGRFQLDFLIGGGLGVGILAGRLDRWEYDDLGNPSYKQFLDGDEPTGTTGVPRVLPLVDVNSGLRFTLGDRAVFRIEGGLHTLLYWGVAGGVTF
jgi:hypothetical protein